MTSSNGAARQSIMIPHRMVGVGGGHGAGGGGGSAAVVVVGARAGAGLFSPQNIVLEPKHGLILAVCGLMQ